MLPVIPFGDMPAVQAGPPTVNGQFYGDGDNAKYVLYNTSTNGSRLYTVLDNTMLYVSLVVARNVNDNVFDNAVTAYMKDAGWNNRPASNLINSEYAGFTLSCGDPIGTVYTWQQAYAYRPGGVGAFVSDHLDPAGGGTPPPWIVSSSSFAWNINNYEAKAEGDRLWNMYPYGSTSTGEWKSPWLAPGNYVRGLDGYPIEGSLVYSTQFEYEWPMVYEWSVNLLTACPGTTVYVFSGSSHHSPSKTGDEDDIFPPPPPDPLMDLGDLPASYGTLLADNGPAHEILVGDMILGATIDSELDGRPTGDATGDDTLGIDDEDGVTLVNPAAWVEGIGGGSVDVAFSRGYTITEVAWLAIWFDWNHDGGFEPSEASVYEQVTWTGNGTTTERFTFDIPPGVGALVGGLYYRARLFTFEPAAGKGAYIGRTMGGEVEDYYFEFPTAVSQLPLSAIGVGSSVTLFWETVSELDNLGFNVYRATSPEGARVRLNAELIPSLVAPGSPFGAAYQYVDRTVKASGTYYYWLESADIYGHTGLQGPVEVRLGNSRGKPFPPLPWR
jgi:hypothetical protein